MTFKVLGPGLKEIRTIPGDFADYESRYDAPVGIDDAGGKHYFTLGGAPVPADVDYFKPLSTEGNGMCMVKKGNKWAYTDNNAKVISPWFQYDNNVYYTDKLGYLPGSPDKAVEDDWGCVAVKQNGKWGVYSYNKNKMLIPCLYDCIGSYYKGGAVAVMKNKKWGLVKFDNGAVIIPLRYDALERVYDNFICVIKLGIYKRRADEITIKGRVVNSKTYIE